MAVAGGAQRPEKLRAHHRRLGEAAIGTYTQGDLYFPDTREFAPPEIQERLDAYVEQMTAAGQDQYINGFAVAPSSALFELAAILGTSLKDDGEERAEGSELVELNT